MSKLTRPVSLLFQLSCITRGHKYKLLTQSMRVDAYFANTVFTAWNSLPASVVDAANVNILRKRLNAVNLSHYYVIV
jgi:hypothetical protein